MPKLLYLIHSSSFIIIITFVIDQIYILLNCANHKYSIRLVDRELSFRELEIPSFQI